MAVTSSSPTTRSGAGPSDAALVVAARAGEAWAQEALFRRHARMVNGLALRLIGRDADLDDLVQEAFAQALGSLDREGPTGVRVVDRLDHGAHREQDRAAAATPRAARAR